MCFGRFCCNEKLLCLPFVHEILRLTVDNRMFVFTIMYLHFYHVSWFSDCNKRLLAVSVNLCATMTHLLCVFLCAVHWIFLSVVYICLFLCCPFSSTYWKRFQEIIALKKFMVFSKMNYNWMKWAFKILLEWYFQTIAIKQP